MFSISSGFGFKIPLMTYKDYRKRVLDDSGVTEAETCFTNAVLDLQRLDAWNKASLVMIPSGYKEDVVYSAIPINGSGDLTFTRASNATRVNSAGLIEKVRTNLNPNGNLVGLALNTSPTGYTNFNTGTFEPVTNTTSEVGTFCKFTTNGTRSFLERTFTGLTIGQPYSFSYKVQDVSGSLLANETFSFFSGITLSSFYINGVSSPTGSDAISDGLIYAVGVATSTSISIRIGIGVTSFPTGVLVLEIGNFQLEVGDIATDYIPTTTTAVSVGMTANVPRLDYSGGGCPKLILEPQRTNLATYSEQFDNAAWSKTNVGVTANTTISPDGYANADKLFNSDGTNGFVSQAMSLVSSTIYSGSFFAKNAGRDSVFVFFSGSGGSANCNFDLTTLTTTPSGGVTAKIEDYGNGWYRCSVVFTATYSGTSGFRIYPSLTTGDGTSGLYIWGAQLEEGSYATSYIPTLGAAVTRGADSCSKTGISSLIGQTEGTLFAEINVNITVINQNIELGDGTSSNRIDLRLNSNNNYQLVIVQGGVVVFNQIAAATFTQGQRIKLAAVYKSGDVTQLFVNGVSVLSATAGTITGNLNAIYSGSIGGTADLINSPVNELIVFPTALTDDECIQLTTL